MKRITDLGIGDLIWVKREEILDSVSINRGTFVKLVVLEFKRDKNTQDEYILARELKGNEEFNINLSGFESTWFINNPEAWNSLS